MCRPLHRSSQVIWKSAEMVKIIRKQKIIFSGNQQVPTATCGTKHAKYPSSCCFNCTDAGAPGPASSSTSTFLERGAHTQKCVPSFGCNSAPIGYRCCRFMMVTHDHRGSEWLWTTGLLFQFQIKALSSLASSKAPQRTVCTPPSPSSSPP